MEKKYILSRGWCVCLCAFICSALWGSAFPCVKIGYKMFGIDSSDSATQILFAGIRFAIAGVLALVIGSVMQKKPLLFKKEQLSKICVISLFQTILQYLFFYIGIAHTTSARASVDVGANVFVVILISSLIFRQEKLSVQKIAGCVIGFAGIVIINLSGLKGGYSFTFTGDGLVLLSTVAYAFSSVFMKKWSGKNNPVMMSAWQFIIGGIVMTATGYMLGGKIESFGAYHLLMLLYLAFISAAAYSLWATLLKYNPVSKVAVYGFMNPVIGVVLSGLLLDEKDSLGLSSMVALFLVCVGIYVVNSNRLKGRK